MFLFIFLYFFSCMCVYVCFFTQFFLSMQFTFTTHSPTTLPLIHYRWRKTPILFWSKTMQHEQVWNGGFNKYSPPIHTIGGVCVFEHYKTIFIIFGLTENTHTHTLTLYLCINNYLWVEIYMCWNTTHTLIQYYYTINISIIECMYVFLVFFIGFQTIISQASTTHTLTHHLPLSHTYQTYKRGI